MARRRDGEKGPYERGSKTKFGYDSRKGFTPCDRDPLGREDAREDELGRLFASERYSCFTCGGAP